MKPKRDASVRCPRCKGTARDPLDRDTCRGCGGRGFILPSRWRKMVRYQALVKQTYGTAVQR